MILSDRSLVYNEISVTVQGIKCALVTELDLVE